MILVFVAAVFVLTFYLIKLSNKEPSEEELDASADGVSPEVFAAAHKKDDDLIRDGSDDSADENENTRDTSYTA